MRNNRGPRDASAGGRARAKKLSPERRREIASAAALARWAEYATRPAKPPRPQPKRPKSRVVEAIEHYAAKAYRAAREFEPVLGGELAPRTDLLYLTFMAHYDAAREIAELVARLEGKQGTDDETQTDIGADPHRT